MRDESELPKGDEDLPPGQKRIAIEHVVPEDLKTLFSNHMTVQHTNEGEFTISFFETLQPLLIGPPDEQAKQFAEIKSTKAVCLARIVMAAERMPRLIGALITNYETYEKDTGKSQQIDTDEQASQKHAS